MVYIGMFTTELKLTWFIYSFFFLGKEEGVEFGFYLRLKLNSFKLIAMDDI